MQGKGLGLLIALLLIAALAGCGGGGSSDSTAETTAPDATEEAVAGRAGTEVSEAIEELRQKEERLREERQAPAKPQGKEGAKEQRASRPDPHPEGSHQDSGGGIAQFATEGGDNSIQESGEEAGTVEREEAAAVLHAYLDARVAHHWKEACFYVAASLSAQIEAFAERYAKNKGAEGCPEVLAGFARSAGQQVLVEAAEADVGALRTEGDHGFLLYHGPGRAPYAMPMAREGGAWKVGSLDGSPLG